MRTTYLKQIKNHNKKLYYFFLIVLAATFVTNVVHNQATPLYVWDMYAGRVKEPTTYKILSLLHNNKELNIPVWRDHKRMYFYYTTSYYLQCVHNGYKDPFQEKAKQKISHLGIPSVFLSTLYSTPSEIAMYPFWLNRYMESNTGEIFEQMSVREIEVIYLKNGRLKITSVKELFNLLK